MRKTSTLKVKFGKNLKEYRMKAGLTQESLAEKTGMSATAISGIETGNSFPSYNNLVEILNVLNIPAHTIFIFPDDVIEYKLDKQGMYFAKIFQDLSDTDKRTLLEFAEFLKSKNQ